MPLNWSILPIRSSLVDVEGLGLAGLAELIQGLTGIGVVDNINNIWQYVIMYLINKHSQSATILVYHTSQLQSLGSADAWGPGPQLILQHISTRFIEERFPPEMPQLFGLHPNAEIGFLTSQGINIFKTVQTPGHRHGEMGRGGSWLGS